MRTKIPFGRLYFGEPTTKPSLSPEAYLVLFVTTSAAFALLMFAVWG